MIIQPPREGLENFGVGETWAIQTDYGGFSSALFTGLGEANVAFYQAEIEPRAPSLESEIDASWLDQVSGTTTLYRNGELVEEQPFGDGGRFEVPPEPASYRVELQHSQGLFELTPRQSVAWTFESEHASEETPARLPLLVVRFAPALDERGRAPTGAFTLPLYIDQYGRISSTLESAPSLEVSFDDGETWSSASLTVAGERWNASLEHPASAAYASLRASARDLNGNAVEQTLIRAYAIAQED